MAVVFEEQEGGLYDLKKDGRVLEYDVEPWDLTGALMRARLKAKDAFVEDETGHRERFGR